MGFKSAESCVEDARRALRKGSGTGQSSNGGGRTACAARCTHGNPVSPRRFGLVERHVRGAPHALPDVAVGGEAREAYGTGEIERSTPRLNPRLRDLSARRLGAR